MKKGKRVYVFVTVLLCMGLLAGCGKKEEVSLSVWTSEEEYPHVEEAVREFTEEYEKEATFNIRINKEDVDSVIQTIQSNPDMAADIFNFASDQYVILHEGDLLLEVTEEADAVIADCGGKDTPIVENVMDGDKLYAYPSTASNGYFMFYNAAYYDEEDVKSLDRMLEIAAENGKYVAMDWSSGWYLYSFFGAAGKTIHADETGQHNVCDFNSTQGEYTGVDVTQAMLEIAGNKGFKNVGSDVIVKEVEKGDIIAVVNGTWNANVFAGIWGEDCRAAKLPTFTLKGQQVQMSSFAGFKYLGVNSHTAQPEWAMKLSRWLTSYDNQLKHFELIGECPANVMAAQSDMVQASFAIAALNEQNEYAAIQNVCDPYWNPMSAFGTYIASGNPDGKDLQTLLDETVSEITK